MDLPKIIVPEPVVENSSKSPAPGDKLSLLSPRVTSGCLFVQVIACSGLHLPVGDEPEKSLSKDTGDVGYYCVLAVEHQTIRTATIPSRNNKCEWDQIVNFDITNPSSKFSLTVWARGHGDQPTKRIGACQYTIGQLMPEQKN